MKCGGAVQKDGGKAEAAMTAAVQTAYGSRYQQLDGWDDWQTTFFDNYLVYFSLAMNRCL